VGGPRRLTVSAAGNRELEVIVDGPESGDVLVFHSGTPSAAVPRPLLSEPASRLGLRTVIYSRPGYSASTAQPGRSVAGCVPDTVAILDHLGVDRFVTVGWSGGGPHALACAALLPERCRAAATLAGVAPYSADGLEWMAGMAQENVTEFGAALQGEEVLNPYLERFADDLRELTGDQVVAALRGLVSEVDKAALTGELAETLAASFRQSVSTGIAGWREDDLAFVGDWGFELAAIEVPVAIWQGSEDRMVPFDHGRWLASHVPGAESRLLQGEGHLSLVAHHLERVYGELLSAAVV
jgi:pimeloyl-ACP methyl ester carboxylesterase